MLEAVVGVALRAILASVLLGGVLAVLVLIATRALALTAATRHALWTTALIATALMPLGGIGVSVLKATSSSASPLPAAHSANVAANMRSDRASRSEHASNAVMRSDRSAPTGASAANKAAGAAAWSAPAISAAPSLGERFAFVHWTPRMSRNLALGVVGIWALGALAGLLGLAGSIARVRGLKRRSSPLDGALADELPWLTEVGPGREIYLRLSYETETPVAIGFRRPVILIPTELATADGLAAIEQLILHEHAHLRRRDDWTNLVQRVIERIFWFNPVVWLVGRRIALEREIASDDAVVEKTGEAHAYATSLWKLVREMRMPEHAVVAPGALLTRKQIAVRIEQLLDKKRARLHRSPGAALGVALASVLAVGFVASSAPAVELPAPAEPPATASASVPARLVVWHADTAQKKDHSAQAVHAAKTTVAKATAAKPAIAEKAKPAPAVLAAAVVKREQAVRYEISSTRIAQTSTAGRTTTATAAPVRERVVTVYVHDSPAPAVSHEALPPLPAVPNVPPFPAPSIRPLVIVPPMKPETVRALRLAAHNVAKSHAASYPHDIANIGPEIGRAVRDVMAAIPSDLPEVPTSTTRRTRLEGVKLSRELIASCAGCSFRGADVRGVDLHGLKISANDFTGADMRGVNLSGARLTGVSLRGANLANADLRNAELAGVELNAAVFDGAQFEGIKLVGVSLRHVSLRGTALRSVIANCAGCDFSRMDLHGQDLHGISLSGADFAHADLHNANLSGVRFSGVDLSYANLAGVDFTNARLEGCNLAAVDLRGARTTGMTLTGTSLDG